MKKEKTYQEVRFSAETLKDAITVAKEIFKRHSKGIVSESYDVTHRDAKWHYDDLMEFLADYRINNGYASFLFLAQGMEFQFSAYPRYATVSFRAATRADIETLFEVFERNLSTSRLQPLPTTTAQPTPPTVFIGHGRSSLWRDLKDHLQDKHSITIEAYETGARAGHTIRDVLDEMASKSTFAILVLTAEDEQSNGAVRARQNVIHEAGLFQGRLGFSRAIMLIEEGVEDFSNAQGIQHIQFQKGNIKETFGEVLATLHREFSR